MADRIWVRSQEPPPEWVSALRAISPKSTIHSWLYLHWSPAIQRWVLYEMVPVTPIERQTSDWVIEELMGPHPDMRDPTVDPPLCSPFQWEAYRRFGVNARLAWIIEGTTGGHEVVYDQPTKELLKATGRPVDPPKPGSLPYAPFDGRVIRQIVAMDKLKQVRNDLAEFKRRNTGAGFDATQKEAFRQARAAMVKHLDDQLADCIADYKAALSHGELDKAPERDVDWQAKDEHQKHSFIETGSLTGLPVGV